MIIITVKTVRDEMERCYPLFVIIDMKIVMDSIEYWQFEIVLYEGLLSVTLHEVSYKTRKKKIKIKRKK